MSWWPRLSHQGPFFCVFKCLKPKFHIDSSNVCPINFSSWSSFNLPRSLFAIPYWTYILGPLSYIACLTKNQYWNLIFQLTLRFYRWASTCTPRAHILFPGKPILSIFGNSCVYVQLKTVECMWCAFSKLYCFLHVLRRGSVVINTAWYLYGKSWSSAIWSYGINYKWMLIGFHLTVCWWLRLQVVRRSVLGQGEGFCLISKHAL